MKANGIDLRQHKLLLCLQKQGKETGKEQQNISFSNISHIAFK